MYLPRPNYTSKQQISLQKIKAHFKRSMIISLHENKDPLGALQNNEAHFGTMTDPMPLKNCMAHS